jgi:hypothetical protein
VNEVDCTNGLTSKPSAKQHHLPSRAIGTRLAACRTRYRPGIWPEACSNDGQGLAALHWATLHCTVLVPTSQVGNPREDLLLSPKAAAVAMSCVTMTAAVNGQLISIFRPLVRLHDFEYSTSASSPQSCANTGSLVSEWGETPRSEQSLLIVLQLPTCSHRPLTGGRRGKFRPANDLHI